MGEKQLDMRAGAVSYTARAQARHSGVPTDFLPDFLIPLFAMFWRFALVER
jgi:hypothetical protein